jgi:hypothetical protein
MGLHFFAHEGHDHAVTAATIPWWQDELTLSIALAIGFILLVGSMHYVFKAKFPVLITGAMAYLLVVGVCCYALAPIASIVAIAAGMFLALTITMLSLAHKNGPGK